ncbi:MAG: CapA family protein [Chloroflexota bacterium]|nr:CapA family protein [Chloroflexota bacterium]
MEPEQRELASDRVSRRAIMRRATQAGAAIAASGPLAAWLAACGAAPDARVIPSPTTAPTTTPAPTATPDTRPVTIAITGDVMLGRSVGKQILATSDHYPFNGVADFLSGFDLTVGNLECVVSTLGSPQPKEYTFEGPPLGFQRVAAAGYDIVSVANNHSGDYGPAAFTDMLAHLPAHGLTALGGGKNLAQAHTPVIRTVRSTTIGFLSYCEIGPTSFAATATTPGHAWLDAALMTHDIRALRPKVDYLIVFTHWGIEYQPLETGHQQAMARLAVDAGADVVVGAHPHVIEPYEMYQGKLIVYSLGNFVFDLMPTEDVRRGNVLTLSVQGPRLLDWKLRTSRITGDFGEPRWL